MLNRTPTARALRRSGLLLLLASAFPAALCSAQPAPPAARPGISAPAIPSRVLTPPSGDEAQQLEAYITTATRTPATHPALGSAVDAITTQDLADQQLHSVSDALAFALGTPVFSSGAPGSTTSLFLRGANSNQTLFLVDGIRMSDPNTDYQTFLGGASFAAHEKFEVARGPQSTLYGADALGGVIAMRLLPGAGPARSAALLEAGTFGTVRGAVASQGAQGGGAWNVSLQAAHTDNERANNALDTINVAMRLDRQVARTASVGTTVRWYHGTLGSPGDRFTDDPNNQDTDSNLLATVFGELTFPDWTARITAGGQERRYVNDTPAPNPPWNSPAQKNVVLSRRGVLDAQGSYTGLDRHRLTVGATAETSHTRNNGYGAIDQRQQLFAVFAQDEFTLSEALFLTAGLRHDDFDTFGSATTGRATGAWFPVPRRLKLRASYGTGFRAPSFLDLYGRDAFYVGNPQLTPERNRGVDAGVDYYLPHRRGTLSATWFRSDFRNLIQYDFAVFPSTVVNLGRARAQGVELAARLGLGLRTDAAVSYTYLQAEALNPAGRTALLRRPRHSVSASVTQRFTDAFTAGVGLNHVGQRPDVDAATFVTVTNPDFSVVRLYAAWQATPRLTLKARLENALDQEYEAVNGYPALGLGAYAGIEWRF